MATRKETGNKGEVLAKEYLLGQGYTIEDTNYRYSRCEIDIIAKRDDILVFVEVKTRSTFAFGHPSSFLKPAQQGRISAAAANYAEEVGHDWEIRFDVISVLILSESEVEIEHIEDAFFPGLY